MSDILGIFWMKGQLLSNYYKHEVCYQNQLVYPCAHARACTHNKRLLCTYCSMLRVRVQVFTERVTYGIISRPSETCVRLFPMGPGANQCSPNRTCTTRLHLPTSLLSWFLNPLLLSLICACSSASICSSNSSP